MIEPFSPLLSQLSRLSEQEYEALIAVTLRELLRLDSLSELPDIDGLSAEETANIIAQERARLEAQIQVLSEQLLAGGTLADFEREMARAISIGMLLLLLFANGGIRRLQSSRISRQIIRRHNDLARRSIKAIQGLGDKIAQGKLTPGQIGASARRRSSDPIADFHTAELLNKIANQGHNEAIRMLDPLARHCPDCPGYQTRGWVPIGEVMPVGWACVCGGRCRCSVYTRFNPSRAIQELQGGSLSDQVTNAIVKQDQAMANFKTKYGLN